MFTLNYAVGIDTGGTFTDISVMDQEGSILLLKTPTTRDYISGIITACGLAARQLGMSVTEFLEAVEKFVYGTTIATNEIVQEKGKGKVGLLTTAGFEDTLYIRRGMRTDVFNGQEPFPEPMARRAHTRGIKERVDFAGNVVCPLDVEQARRVIRELLQQSERTAAMQQIEAVAICLLHSYANPEHEKLVMKLVKEESPDLYVSASIEVAPEIREYERMSTTVCNAAVGRIGEEHFSRIGERLAASGLRSPLLIMQSNGGVTGVGEVVRKPVTTIISGPTGGVMGAKFLGNLLGVDNILTMDMGGTSFDVGIIYRGEVISGTRSDVSGYPIVGDRLEVRTIGAGGGSIGWVDEYGVLKVGPQSAGAEPGPVCYGQGGVEPTITDADVVLGYIDPNYFLGGQIPLDQQAAQQAIATLADKMNMESVEVAYGMERILHANMINALRLISVEKGYDPREFTMVAFGGAGPSHCSALLKEMGCQRLVVPSNASGFSSYGLLCTHLKHNYSRTYRTTLAGLQLDHANALLAEMEEAARKTLAAEGIGPDAIVINASVDASYIGQLHEINVPLQGTALSEEGIAELKQWYAEKYMSLYGFREELPIQTVTFRVEGIGKVVQPAVAKKKLIATESAGAIKCHRAAYFPEDGGFISVPVYDSTKLAPGSQLAGPAIVEYPTTTLVVYDGQQVCFDEFDNAIITLG